VKYFFSKLLFIFVFTTQVNAQQFDTIFVYDSGKNGNKLEIIDFYLRNNSSYVVLYSENKELYVIDSEKNNKVYKLNARLASVSGDKYTESKSFQVKGAKLYNEGYLVTAASDQNHDQLGGRFLRWDLKKQQVLPEILTSSEGIGKFAVSSDGRYFVNYYYPKYSKKTEIIDAFNDKHYTVKTRLIIYADNIYFTQNNKKLVFEGSWVNNQFDKVVFDIPGFKQNTTNDELTENNTTKCSLNDNQYFIQNDSLIIENVKSAKKKVLPLKSKAKISGNNSMVLLTFIIEKKLEIIRIID